MLPLVSPLVSENAVTIEFPISVLGPPAVGLLYMLYEATLDIPDQVRSILVGAVPDGVPLPPRLLTQDRAGPEETTRFTAEPGATELPAAGFSLITLPAATVLLDAVVTVPSTRPAF